MVIVSNYAVYGFGSDTFTSPEAQLLYQVPFAYFKGPSNTQLRVAIGYNGEGTGIVIVYNVNIIGVYDAHFHTNSFRR